MQTSVNRAEHLSRRWRYALGGLVCAAILCVFAAPFAHAATSGFGDHDTSNPIQFSAQQLEVRKEGRVATFQGNVQAIQGDLRVFADQVKVYYRSGGDSEGFGGSVERIDTSGNVTIRSGDDSARGDWAVYDVERKLMTLGGAVELKRGDTVIRGSRVEIDLKSGRSKVEGVPVDGEDRRVRGEFTPKSDGDGGGDESGAR